MNADMRLLNDYAAKPLDYYGNPRADFVASMPDDPTARILELGCGSGATGALALEQGKCGAYFGIESFTPMAARAREVLTEVISGDIERLTLPYAPASFDALVAGEVLEHLADPDAVLATLAPLLKPGGRVYASSPNIAHWQIIGRLLLGRFDYTESGVMDRTHLRWFTPATFREMFEGAGIVVDGVHRLGARVWRPRLFWTQIDLRGHRPD